MLKLLCYGTIKLFSAGVSAGRGQRFGSLNVIGIALVPIGRETISLNRSIVKRLTFSSLLYND
jgi:hypothetical protein